jgi:hypothetical protein
MHTAEAQQLLDQLERELAAAGERAGAKLSWTVAEAEVLEMLARTVDRRAGLAARYDKLRDIKVKVKVSVELRQLDNTVVKLLKAINTEVPQEDSVTTIKARRAANVRWDRARASS